MTDTTAARSSAGIDNTSLAIFTRAALMLAEANTIQKAKELKDLALTAGDFARRKEMGEEAIQHCRCYAFEAERRLGELLAQTERAKGGNPKLPTGTRTLPVEPTLADLGISKNESSKAQKLAALPVESFEAVRDGLKRFNQIQREQKEQAREQRRTGNREKASGVQSADNIGAKFATIIADPPWDWGDEGDGDQFGRAKPDYATLSKEQLLALPVGKLADEDCHLYLWITNRSLPKGFALLEAWGFRYVTTLTWPKPSFGMGNYFRGQTEHVLFGVKGSQELKRKNAATLLPTWKRGPNGHSSKPVEFREFVESCSPGPYLEMFSRSPERKDWTTWGEDS